MNHFSGHIELLKRAYFSELNAMDHGDQDGKNFSRLLDADNNFVVEYVDWLYEKHEWVSEHDDNRDYSFLWDREDYNEIMVKAADRIFRYEKERSDYSYFKVFFGLPRNGEVLQNINPRQINFLMTLIENRSDDIDFMQFLFALISNFPAEDRVKFVLKFVELHNSFEDFKKLQLEPLGGYWRGGAVPMLQSRVDYLKMLIPIFDCVSLLKHKQHIEQTINKVRAEIEQEKKNEFMEY